MTIKDIYDKYYPVKGDSSVALNNAGNAREILENHSQSVARLALSINANGGFNLNPATIEQAAMLHDIGIFLTSAPGIFCFGDAPYILHGVLGADILRKEGFDEEIARVAERHTGAGITPDDIANLNLPLPTDRILYPESLLEKLICYADKFYSKSGDMKIKPIDKVRASMLRHSRDTLCRFEKLHALFGDFMP